MGKTKIDDRRIRLWEAGDGKCLLKKSWYEYWIGDETQIHNHGNLLITGTRRGDAKFI